MNRDMAFSLGGEVNAATAADGLTLRFPQPFTGIHQVEPAEIDEYEHVNNTVYLRWLDTIAWAHSLHLGMSLERCIEMRRGMAIRHTRVDYLEAAMQGDTLLVATWIVSCDGRLRCSRRFEILRVCRRQARAGRRDRLLLPKPRHRQPLPVSA